MSKGVAIVVLGESALPVAKKLAGAIPNALVHGLASRVRDVDAAFADTADHFRALFESGTTIVAMFAAGAAIRMLAPLLSDKRKETPVLAVAEDGSAVVPLVGGHHGAN